MLSVRSSSDALERLRQYWNTFSVTVTGDKRNIQRISKSKKWLSSKLTKWFWCPLRNFHRPFLSIKMDTNVLKIANVGHDIYIYKTSKKLKKTANATYPSGLTINVKNKENQKKCPREGEWSIRFSSNLIYRNIFHLSEDLKKKYNLAVLLRVLWRAKITYPPPFGRNINISKKNRRRMPFT